MPRSAYAPAYARSRGQQTAYTAGLSYFPDGLYANEPLGNVLATVAGDVGVPGGASIANLAESAFSGIFGGGGAVDAQRKAKAQYVLQRALAGNVAAVQFIIAAPQCVSGNEAPYWQAALQAVQNSPNGAQLIQDAQAAGPTCLSGAGDTATNYPALLSFLNNWDGQNGTSTLPGAVTLQRNLTAARVAVAPLTNALTSPLALLAGAGIVALFLLKRRG